MNSNEITQTFKCKVNTKCLRGKHMSLHLYQEAYIKWLDVVTPRSSLPPNLVPQSDRVTIVINHKNSLSLPPWNDLHL